MSFFDKIKNIQSRNEYIDHDVDGQTFRFYTLRMKWLWTGELNRIVQPMMKAVSVLFESSDKDKKHVQTVKNMPTGDFTFVKDEHGEELALPVQAEEITTLTDATNPELVKFRSQRRDDAVDEALKILMSPVTAKSLARILMDSLRDEEWGANPSNAQIDAFLDCLDVSMLKELCVGFFKANVSKMTGGMKNWMDQIQQAAQERMKKFGNSEMGPSTADNSSLDKNGTSEERPIRVNE